MSDSKKMSSPYVVLENRPLDQWKVAELKEELKRRKLMTKGLKEELVRRLDEAVRAENAETHTNLENGFENTDQPEVPSDSLEVEPIVAEQNESLGKDNTTNELDINKSLKKDNETEKLDKYDSFEKDNEPEQLDINTSLEKDNETEKLDKDESFEKDNESEKLDINTSLEKDNESEKLDINTSLEKDNETEKLDTNESFEKDNETQKLDKNESFEKDNETEKLDKNESFEKDNESEKLDKNESFEKDSESQNLDKNENFEKDNETKKLDKNESLKTDDMAEKWDNDKSDRVHVDDGLQSENGDSKPESQSPKEEIKPGSYDISSQVVEVSQVKSDSISIDSMPITEKNELKDNVIADVKLELDVKPEMVQPSFDKNGGKSELILVDEDKDVKIGENMDVCKKNDSGDVGSPEKLNLDRSSGDDSMEEDVLESKQIDDTKVSSLDISEKMEVPLVKEDDPVDVMVVDIPAAKNTESSNDLAVVSAKRKIYDQDAAANTETVKRQRRWNSEGLKLPEQPTTLSAATTPKDALQTSFKHSFSRSDSSVSQEAPKERVVPPSSKPATTSLRIDRFLRPFTLKAVQELLGKTGRVVSFWMDHIKTHCYVTYSSVEEAVETRNAVYNLQWPANGGRFLVAEFVDPSEVKTRLEAPLPSPPTPTASTTTTPTPPQPPPTAMQPPPSQPQQLPPPPPLPLPPPPPLSLPPPSRETPSLPPPPPLLKVEPPIVTLDDLFRKTRATPRIYYLPLTEEQVAAKLKGHGKTAVKQ